MSQFATSTPAQCHLIPTSNIDQKQWTEALHSLCINQMTVDSLEGLGHVKKVPWVAEIQRF